MELVKVPMDELIDVLLLQLEKGGKTKLVVTGVSMRPMLTEHRDSVLLVPLNGDPVPGDIVLYRRENGRYVLHRVIRRLPDAYLFCGDNQYTLEKVTTEQMIAVVGGFFRKGREYTLDAPLYRLYSWVWVKLFFLRKIYIKVRRKLGRIANKLTGRRK